MNDEKQKQLFAAARTARPVEAPADFSASVQRALARERREESMALFDQLAEWFPRLATAALAIIVMALALDFYLDGDLVLQLAEVSEQWLLPVDWL